LIEKYFDPSAFALPPLGSYGNFGRNVLDAPGGYTLDSSVFRTFRLTEKAHVQFRSEFFNALNHPVLGAPVSSLAAPTAGHILSAGPPRILQFAVKLIY
jgi:hypothetical protein